jgi:dTDP-glucose 4,6-dehydratase
MTQAQARRILVTGGAGFIGSALVRHLVAETGHEVCVVDKLTYAGGLEALAPVTADSRYRFFRADIADGRRMREIVAAVRPSIVMNLAAETHVDRSIDGSAAFLRTNIGGTHVLLDVVLRYWQGLRGTARDRFRFHQVSTDEVFGSLGSSGVFNETSAYRPSSPYSASKAAADHLVRAWHSTYGLPTLISNSTNNYGPFQFPEKLIPLTIATCIGGQPISVYGDGSNRRDWLFVDDHVRALVAIATRGRPGGTYLVGSGSTLTNLEVVKSVCALVDARCPDPHVGPRERLIAFVADRPGHDFRYAVDTNRMRTELSWTPSAPFASRLAATVDWYLANRAWWESLRASVYGGERLGLAG